MWIQKLQLRNFQRHKILKAEFDEDFTLICGENDAGKSSIIRALFWVFFNAPAGDWMRRKDKKGELTTTKVKIFFSNGTMISRIKGEDINQYSLDDEAYDNFGRKIPEPIINFLNIKKLKFGIADCMPNLGMQDDPTFMVHESGGVRAAMINYLTGVDIAEDAIKSINSDLRGARLDKKYVDDRLKIVREERDSLPKITKAVKTVQLIDRQLVTVSQLEEQCQYIVEQKNIIDTVAFKIGKCDTFINSFDLTGNELEQLKELDQDIIILEKCKAEIDTGHASSKFYNDFQSGVDSVTDQYDLLKKLESELTELRNYYTIIHKYAEVSQKVIKVEGQLSKFKDTLCPTCGGVMR